MTTKVEPPRGRIIGIGGVFLKSAGHDQLSSWYRDKLGLPQQSDEVMFKWRSHETPEIEHLTVWSVFPAESPYFNPSKATFMINYIVDDLDAILARLRSDGVEIDPKREDYDYGRFAWIFDPDGNKIELWEPPVSRASHP
jgi:catechol 2,3-dioxygenase-like lactoylglutathione lyase family enzyme